jgi:transcriptional regulator GlxA family with amidase domain
MWVRTAQGDWVVPPNRAVWVPAGIRHSIEMVGPVLVQTLYLAADTTGPLPTRCAAVNVSPLMRELIRHIVATGVLNRNVPERARTIDFLLDQLLSLPAVPLQLPSPRDLRARRAADWMRSHPGDPAAIKRIARRVCTSPRTLERIFRRETGMTFGKWRQQLRLLHAMRLLAAGRPVTTVAFDVGYDSPSAFVAMFRRTLGETPRRYFATTDAAVRSEAL